MSSSKKTRHPFLENIVKASRSFVLHPFAYTFILLSILLVTWPLFLINDAQQYPECIAYDLFPPINGYSPDAVKSFIYYIQLPLTVVGCIIFLKACETLKGTVLKTKNVIYISAFFLSSAFSLYVYVLILGFDLSGANCTHYPKALPDINPLKNLFRYQPALQLTL